MMVLAFILILSFLVIIHELGHFVAARFFKVRVEEFGLGYPPKALTLFKKWGTIFSLNFVPFGGFVKMEGEDEHGHGTIIHESLKSEGPFYAKPAWAKLIIVLAGALVNFAFGVMAFASVFSLLGIPSGALISQIVPDSPASQMNLPANIAITGIQVDGRHYKIDSAGEVLQTINQNLGKKIVLETVNVCQKVAECEVITQTYEVQLRSSSEVGENRPGLGISPTDYLRFYPWYEMPFRGAWVGLEQALVLGRDILGALGGMLRDLIMKGSLPGQVSGPVGIVHEASRSGLLNQGPVVLLLFTGMLSINLAIMNVLPIPALDGGRAVFIILEKILGRKHVGQVESYANYGGYIVLVGLIILVTAKDIFKIVTGN